MAIDLNMLKYIRTVYECGSISKAAHELFISQPYLSQSIKKFEVETGITLFDRSSHPLKITPAGMCFVQWSKNLDASERSIMDKARLLSNGPQNILTIISSRLRNIAQLPAVISHLQAYAPDYRVIVKTATSVEKRISALMEREADVLLDMRPYAVSSELGVREIGSEKLFLALPYAHPLTPRKGEQQAVRLRDFAGHNFVSCQNGMYYYDILVRQCANAGFFPKIVVETPDIPTCCAAVAEGIGVSIVPEVIVKSILYRDWMVFFPIIGCEEKIPCYLTYYKEVESVHIFPVFLNLRRESF